MLLEDRRAMSEEQGPDDAPLEDVVDPDALVSGPGWTSGDVTRGAESRGLPEWVTDDLTVDGTA